MMDPMPDIEKAYSRFLQLKNRDWYKSLNDNKKKKGIGNNNFAGSIEEKPIVPVVHQGTLMENRNDMADLVSEIVKMVQQRNIPMDPITNFADYAQCDDEFAALFELVHLDVWGPYKTPTISGCNYILTILDDHSRTLWTYLIKHKSQVPSILTSFYNMIDTQFSAKVKTLRDVLFHEDVFPYALNHPSTPSTIPLPIVPANSDIHIPPIFPDHSSAAVSPIPTESHPQILSSETPSSTQSISPSLPTDPPPLRRSNRTIHKPVWLNDFINSHHDPSLLHSINTAYLSFVASLSILQKPWSFTEAVKYPKWREAMQAEIAILEQNHTWSLTPLPPVAKAVTVWLFSTLAAANGWFLQQLDVNNAFLHGYLDKDLYMSPPDGYPVESGLSPHDHCLFTLSTESGLIGLLVYVDDILLTGLEIARISSGIYLAQTNCPRIGALLLQPDSYRRLVGRLLYLEFTRLDISHPVQQLSQFLNNPCEDHWNAALHVVRYLKGCPSKGLFLPSDNSLALQAYYDADWASCTDSRPEAEYRSLAATVCELKWLSYLLTDFGISPQLPIPLYCDNKAALHILANPVFHERTKHIELDCHLVQDAYEDGFVLPIHVRSSDQFVDLFMKVLPLKLFSHFLSKLGLVSLVPRPTCGGAVGIVDAAPTMADLRDLCVAAGEQVDLMDQG
ncbi:UNVERIFIED_CONTAM: Retrovirus-related Pol polyprotein from transposon RE2 [Sesamum latifolium]|uniref:Retrovirus-related Pol polyprotein from transposon RE2 n=1 Tax=Sesamum latifolium TaxID=2727402 RepID=A0AAW2XCJ5_9LAMI